MILSLVVWQGDGCTSKVVAVDRLAWLCPL